MCECVYVKVCVCVCAYVCMCIVCVCMCKEKSAHKTQMGTQDNHNAPSGPRLPGLTCFLNELSGTVYCSREVCRPTSHQHGDVIFQLLLLHLHTHASTQARSRPFLALGQLQEDSAPGLELHLEDLMTPYTEEEQWMPLNKSAVTHSSIHTCTYNTNAQNFGHFCILAFQFDSSI